jgi:hypothetical protein
MYYIAEGDQAEGSQTYLGVRSEFQDPERLTDFQDPERAEQRMVYRCSFTTYHISTNVS